MGAERLEPRAMMAIFTYGRPDGSTLVAIDGNASLTDLYLRNTLGGVQVATNSQFAAVPTFDEADWRNGTPQPPSFNPNLYSIDSSAPIYVTNATPNFFEFETEADGFLDGDDSNVTDFVLSNGNLNTATPGAVNGELRLDNRAWSFTNNGTGGLLFTQIAGPVAGPAPRNVLSTVSPGVTEPDSRGQGVRGAITIQWTAPVSTFVDTCPRIDVSYTYRNFTGAPADPPPPSLSGVDSNLGVSAGSRVTFSIQGDPLDKEITLGGTTLGIVPGTLVNSGTITVHDVCESETPAPDTRTFDSISATPPARSFSLPSRTTGCRSHRARRLAALDSSTPFRRETRRPAPRTCSRVGSPSRAFVGGSNTGWKIFRLR
jgi:hypothetical protein